MMHHPRILQRRPLYGHLCWFVRLRWVAAGAVILGALIDQNWLQRYPQDLPMLLLGSAILLYNLVFFAALPRLPGSLHYRRWLLTFSCAQLALDLGCLTCLTLWTGGLTSPLLGFYVFHMVFASLLLPRFLAYGGAVMALLMLSGGLWLTGRWPVQLDAKLAVMGWAMTLVLTVGLINQITRGLRRQRRRLIRQNHHIRRISQRLQRQQQAMIQHEKMVAMGQMAAGVAHEIANPLASMDGLLQLIQRKPQRLDEETVATLREQVARINQIVRQMTAFAHPTDANWQVAALNEVVDAALQMVRFDHRLRRVQIHRQFSDAAGELRLQPHALQQVLVNLVFNALDALADVPQPQLTLRTDRQGPWCVIEVTDNGHGIRPEHLDRLFEPFFTTKPVGKGTGLGLSISYSLVRQQGGSIDVTSQVGHGATFTVRLPASEASRNRETVADPIAVSEKQPR